MRGRFWLGARVHSLTGDGVSVVGWVGEGALGGGLSTQASRKRFIRSFGSWLSRSGMLPALGDRGEVGVWVGNASVLGETGDGPFSSITSDGDDDRWELGGVLEPWLMSSEDVDGELSGMVGSVGCTGGVKGSLRLAWSKRCWSISSSWRLTWHVVQE